MVGGGALRDGDAALGGDDDRHAGAGGHGRHPVRAALLRATPRHGHPRRHTGAVPAWLGGVHGLRVPRTSVRRPDPLADRLPVPAVPRHVGGGDHGGPRGGAECHLRNSTRVERGPDRRSDHPLYDGRWRAGGRLGRCETDGADRGGAGGDRSCAARADAGQPG